MRLKRRALSPTGWPLAFALAFLLAGCGGRPGVADQPVPEPQVGTQQHSSVAAAEPPAVVAPTATPDAAIGSSAIATPQANTPPTLLPVSGERAYQHVKELAEKIGSRPMGSDKERAAAAYIGAQLESFGYRTERQGFELEIFQVKAVKATVQDPTQSFSLNSVRALQLSGAGEVRAPLVSVGLGQTGDLPAEGLAGKVALIERGTIEFREKVANVAAAGAIGAMIYNNQPGPFSGALRQTSSIPAVSLSQEDGQRILGLLGQGPVQVNLSVDAGLATLTSQNVIGRGDTQCRIVIGGHYDSVAEGPGANDNASGTAAVLEIARSAQAMAASWGLCFIAFGGEELGLHGSRHYVAALSPQEQKAMVGMINLDMVGVGQEWKLAGSEELIEAAAKAAKAAGVPLEEFSLPRGVGSDHLSFTAANVPTIFIHRVDDPNYHSPEDKAAYVSPQALEQASKVALAIVQEVLMARAQATP